MYRPTKTGHSFADHAPLQSPPRVFGFGAKLEPRSSATSIRRARRAQHTPRKEPDVTRIRECHNRRNGTTATSKRR